MGRADRHVLEFGGEIGSGDAFPGTDRNRNGVGTAASTRTPAATSARATAGAPAFRTCSSGRATATTLQTTSRATTRNSSFTGTSELAIADFVWK